MSILPSRPEIFLHPGEFCFGPAPGRIGTLLGSCVAVTVWHPQRHFGGMCHILLPGRLRPPGSLPDCRYADEAIERFAYELRARRVEPCSCQVKLFGGGNMFAGTRADGMDVGRRNVDATRAALDAYDFRIMIEHVGGTARRRLFIDLMTGHVWLAVPQDNKPQPRKEAA
jgi:chemotaxis protein CheD